MDKFRQKIRKFEQAHIVVGDYAHLDISEESDAWHLDISQNFEKIFRVAIPFKSGHGKHYLYWDDIVRIVQKEETSKE